MNSEEYPFAIFERVWANSQLSIARYTGRVRLGKYEYVICNKDGKDIFECSKEAEKAGRKKAIEPGEPADLVRTDILPIYRELGRAEFIMFCAENTDCFTFKQLKQRLKEWKQK